MLFSVMVTSCQKEENIVVDPADNTESFSGDSNIVADLLSATQNDGSLDNLIDGTSCFSLDFPVQVVANGQEVTLNSIEDIQLIEAIYNGNLGDSDGLELVFPVTLISDDFSQEIVNDLNAYNALLANCNNNVADDYNCLDFQFPISGVLYNASNEQTGTLNINSDREWFSFLSTLTSDVYVAINYPITIIVNGGSTSINSNTELFNAFNQLDCNSPGGNTESLIDEFLISGIWHVTYFGELEDQTCYFDGYSFTFNPDGNALADNGTQTAGSWVMYNISGIEMVEFDFGSNPPLNELFEEWEILSGSDELIELRYNNTNSGFNRLLTFGREPSTCENNEIDELINDLTNDDWHVILLEANESETACDYVEYSFNFIAKGTSGIVQAVSSTGIVDGVWAVSSGDSGLELNLTFDITGQNDPFEDLNEDWDVIISNSDQIQLQIFDNNGNGGNKVLFFARAPLTGCGSTWPATIEGKWILEDIQNTMYIFHEDGLRYTVYCVDQVCDWENLGIDDAIPNPNPYTFIDNILTVDLFFGNTFSEEMEFRCDNNVVQYEFEDINAIYDIRWFRPGYDISLCD